MIGRNDIYSAARLFDPDRLTIARELRGLTKQELAEKIGRTPSAVSQFESGRARPDGQSVGRLMLALSVPASFFAKMSDSHAMRTIALIFVPFQESSVCHPARSSDAPSKGHNVVRPAEFLQEKVNLPDERVTMLAGAPARC